MPIRLLDEETINQIAAGEVVENSSSVVKELVENALDAGASQIIIEIVAGGKQLIRISDNGKGMNESDAHLALKRHATSKIATAADLMAIGTMGFRGEALAAIGSVSKIRLITNECLDETKGLAILQEAGQLLEAAPCLRPKGTTFEVRSLFYNTPARRKFQRSINADTASITKIVQQLALAHPNVHFELIQGTEKIVFRHPEPLKERICALLGEEEWLAIDAEEGPYRLSGYISPPTRSRGNRTGQFLFINNRAVTSPLVSIAVLEGYGTLLESKRYPLFVLHLTMDKALVDVNVHPQKLEVRLRDEQFLRQWLAKAVSTNFHKSVSALPWENRPAFIPSSLPPLRYEAPQLSLQPSLSFERRSFPLIGSWKEHLLIDLADVPSHHNVTGSPDTIMVLHRQRARQSLLATQFAKDDPPAAHYLTESVAVELSAHEMRVLQSHDLAKWGFVIRPFGPKTVLVEALPAHVTNVKETLLSFIEGSANPALAAARCFRGDSLPAALWLDAFFNLEQIRWSPEGESNFFLCELNNYKKS